MSGHRRIAEAGGRPTPATLQGAKCDWRYIDPAPVADVMFEQLEYLAAHAVQSCPPDCSDCARLAQIKNWLLLPFNSSRLIKPAHAPSITASVSPE